MLTDLQSALVTIAQTLMRAKWDYGWLVTGGAQSQANHVVRTVAPLVEASEADIIAATQEILRRYETIGE